MATIIGTIQTPIRIDVEIYGRLMQVSDLKNIPPNTPITAVRRIYGVKANRKYKIRTEWINTVTGEVDERISNEIPVAADGELVGNHTVGRLDSPLNYEWFDVTPA